MEEPAQKATPDPPLIVGNGLTVTTVATAQPLASVYEIVVVPAETPVTIPVPDPILATPVLVLVQIPPPVASLSRIVCPTQVVELPVIAAGAALTVKVTALVAVNPLPSVAVTV